MVSDFGSTRYCKRCGHEIIREGDCVTISEDSKFCECNKKDDATSKTGVKDGN